MSPIGKTALLQSSPLSVVDSTIPLPGGGALSLSGTSVSYLHSDWLATKRVKSSVPATGNGTVLSDTASAPYGETYLTFGSSPLDTFTGDASWLSSQVSDTPNREYRMGQGRWLSTDPAGAGWNAYAYGTDPNTQTDPTGLMIWPGEMNFGYLRISNNTDAASMWMVNFQQWLYFASVHADDANRANAEAWYSAKYAELRDYNHSLFQHDAEGFAIRPQNQIQPPSAVAGTLMIDTVLTGQSSKAVDGHAWLTFTPDGGTIVTYGTYGNANGKQSVHGVNEDSEIGLTPSASRSAHLTAAEATSLSAYIADEIKMGSSAWGLTDPCSAFAAEGWRWATGEMLSDGTVLSNPSNLQQSIVNANGGSATGMLTAPVPQQYPPAPLPHFP
jgi:RHS repeat-associated protein